MSIIAGVKVYDGVVLAAESVTQITGRVQEGIQFVKSYRYANKLFQIEKLPIGVATYGVGNIGSRSVQNYITQFSVQEMSGITDRHVRATAERLLKVLREAYEPNFGQLPVDQRPVLGAYVAGYSPGSTLAEEWEFALPTDTEPTEVRPQGIFGASWRGITLPFNRLYRGFDPRIEARLAQLGVDQKILEQVKAEFPSLPITFDGMPLQDAVSFAHFIISTTVYVANFEIGIASCGGPIDIAVIRPEAGFEWVAQKQITAPGVGGLYGY